MRKEDCSLFLNMFLTFCYFPNPDIKTRIRVLSLGMYSKPKKQLITKVYLARISGKYSQKFLWKEFSRKPTLMWVSIRDDTHKSSFVTVCFLFSNKLLKTLK